MYENEIIMIETDKTNKILAETNREINKIEKTKNQNQKSNSNITNTTTNALTLVSKTIPQVFNITDEHYEYINNYLPEINISHLKKCDCCEPIKHIVRELLQINKKDGGLKTNYKTNPNTNDSENFMKGDVNYYHKEDPEDIINKHTIDLINEYGTTNKTTFVCPYVHRELLKTVRMFKKDYDLNLTKVRLIVNGILSYQASLIESVQMFKRQGAFEVVQDREGNVYTKVADNEHYKMKLNEKIIDAINTLDKMIEGSKNVNVNINHESISIEDLLTNIRKKQT